MTNSEQLQKNNERIEAVTLMIQSKAAGGQATLTAEQLITLLEDTETVVSMLSDDGSKIKLQLSASQVNKIMKALTTPTIAPSETELVAIDDGNSQVLLTIGDGLVIEDGELKSTVAGFDGDFNSLKNVPTASEGTKGLIQIASDLDVVDGTNTTKAINAKQLNVAIKGLGIVFRIKGSKQLAAELPSTGNTLGDVWYVSDESVGYIWLNDGTRDRWEQLGLPIDLTSYALKSDLEDCAKKTDLNDYVAKATDYSDYFKVYGYLAGGQKTIEVSSRTLPEGTIPMRDANGQVKVSTPTRDNSAANKKYVDDTATTKVNIADIVNGLTSTDTTKPLSAMQGKVLNDQLSTLSTTVAGVKETADKVAAKYLKGAEVQGKRLVLVDQDGSQLYFDDTPSEYLTSATVSDNKLTIVNNSGGATVFEGGGAAPTFLFDAATRTLTIITG